MSLFRSQPASRSVAQVLVREVHVTVLQLAAYLGVFAALAFGAVELASSPHLERALTKLATSPAFSIRSDWIEAAQTPKLRGRD